MLDTALKRELLSFLLDRRGLTPTKLLARSVRENWQGRKMLRGATDAKGLRYESSLDVNRNGGIEWISLTIRCLDLEPTAPGYLVFEQYLLRGTELHSHTHPTSDPIPLPPEVALKVQDSGLGEAG